jgi:hydroxyacylglutathione hydrolase
MMRWLPITSELSYSPERFRRCNTFLLTLAGQSVLFDPSILPDLVPGYETVRTLYATHAHYDHIGAIKLWKEKLPAAHFVMHAEDEPMLGDAVANDSILFGRPSTFCRPDLILGNDDERIFDDRFGVRLVHTPGHTMGSSCFLIARRDGNQWIPQALLTGDTLFDCGWGRTDFVTGNDQLMRRSLEALYRLLKDLPADLPVCPGHGGITNASQACRFLHSSGFSG